jgi:glycosyltransferase involved in cell wall biosynthesis
MKPRLIFYITSFEGGGAERVFLNLIQGFIKHGFIDIWLILNKAKGLFLSYLPHLVHIVDLKEPEIPFHIYHLPYYMTQKHTNSFWLDSIIKVNFLALKVTDFLRRRNLRTIFHLFLMSIKLIDQINRIRPNILLSGLTNCNLIAILAHLFTNNYRMIISEHSTPSLSIRFQSTPGIILWMMRHLYPQANKIIAVSKGVADDLINLLNLSNEKIETIYNPVVTPDLFVKARQPISHPWFEQNRLPVILAVGRLRKAKDYPTLFRAFSLVRQIRPAKLLILGEGEERSNLERLAIELGIQNDVSMPGFVDNPFAFMAKASVFVLSSAWEGFGNVLVEALACGCPVVATDCRSGPREILDNGRYGRLVPVGDHEALAKAILETLDNPDFPADRQTRLQRAMEFSVDVAIDRYMKVLLD